MARWMVFCAIICLGTLGIYASTANSQTQCPGGVAAGSYGCGPDGAPAQEAPSIPTRWAVKDGYGAYAFTNEGYNVFWYTENSRDPDRAVNQVLANCAAAGYSDCELLFRWKNSCAVLGFARGRDEIDQLFAADAKTKREAIRLMEAKCAGKGYSCTVNNPFTQCVKRRGGWETYTPVRR